MRTTLLAAAVLAACALVGWFGAAAQDKVAQKLPAGFPAPDDTKRDYDEADLNRAVQVYKYFYPTVQAP